MYIYSLVLNPIINFPCTVQLLILVPPSLLSYKALIF